MDNMMKFKVKLGDNIIAYGLEDVKISYDNAAIPIIGPFVSDPDNCELNGFLTIKSDLDDRSALELYDEIQKTFYDYSNEDVIPVSSGNIPIITFNNLPEETVWMVGDTEVHDKYLRKDGMLYFERSFVTKEAIEFVNLNFTSTPSIIKEDVEFVGVIKEDVKFIEENKKPPLSSWWKKYED